MLQELRQQSRSFIIWILFGIIIVVFVISFGPQANAELGCGASDIYTMKVKDKELGQHSWRFAMNGLPYVLNIAKMPKPKRAELAMDLMLQRELLAQAAESSGFRVSTDLVNDKIKHGEWYLMGYRIDGRGWFFDEGVFSYERLESASRSLGLPTVEHFIEQQRRELLAETMRGLIMGSVQISRDELLASFTHQNTRATIDYVKYRTGELKRGMVLSDEDVAAYAATHEDKIKEKFTADEATYKDVKPQARIRQIFLARTAKQPEPPGRAPADGQPAPLKQKKEAKPAPDPAQKKAEAAHKKLVGGADFAALAEKLSDDKRSAAKGGDLGWRSVSAPGLGHAKLSEALAKLKAGELSEVIDTPRGFYIIRVEELREGDLTLEQVKVELARDLARAYYAREAAWRAAEATLAEAKAGKKLAEMFEREEEAPANPQPGIDMEKLRQQLPEGTDVEELLKNIKIDQRGEQGAIYVESENIPAQSKAEVNPAAAPAVKPEADAKKPGTEADAKEPEAKPVVESRPPADQEIPTPIDLKPPKLLKAGPFNRDANRVPGVGESGELVQDLFEVLENGQLGEKVYEVADGFVVVQLITREEPDLDLFARTENDLRQSHMGGKGFDALRDWVQDSCQRAVKNKQVVINKEFLSYNDDQGKPIPISYQPCGNL